MPWANRTNTGSAIRVFKKYLYNSCQATKLPLAIPIACKKLYFVFLIFSLYLCGHNALIYYIAICCKTLCKDLFCADAFLGFILTP